MLFADCDLEEQFVPCSFDSVGHYSREEAILSTLERARTASERGS